MKITLSREEIEEVVRKFYNFDGNVQIEISTDKAEAKPEPEIQYRSKYDSNGLLLEMVPINSDGSLVNPHINHKGQKFKFENTCKVCGKVFYTNQQAVDCCSKECLTQLNKQCLSEIEEAQLHEEAEKQAKIVKTGSNRKKRSTKKQDEKQTKSKSFAVKNPKNDYLPIGEEIESFCNSDEEKKIIISETLTAQGLYYRYRVAAKMFGYDNRIKLSTPRNKNMLVISKR